jgi:O-antigen/teichoic acid export membrane protein
MTDATGASERNHRRGKHIKLSVLTGLIARASSMLMTIVSVPLTLSYLGNERFGLWMTVTSLVSMLTFADFGIGNGLLTVVAEASGRDDLEAIRRYISSGFAILVGIAACMLLLFFSVVNPLVNWPHVFNVHTATAQAESAPAIAALVVCVAGSISSLIVPRVQIALQHGFIYNAWVTVGLIASISAIWMVSAAHGSVPLLILALSGVPQITAGINGLIFFYRNRQYRPSWSLVNKAAMKRILNTGILFVLLQAGISISFASDKLIIARLLGAETVASYSLYERVFGVGVSLMMVMLTPIWPAYAEAWARNDTEWVKRALRRSISLALSASAVFSVFVVMSGPLIVSLWTRKTVPVEPIVLYALGIWCVIQCTSNALSMLLNGLNMLRIQVISSILTACVAIPLKVILVRYVGPAGAVLASSAVAICFSLVPFSIVVWKIVRKSEGPPKDLPRPAADS